MFFDNEAMYNYCLSYENKELLSILSLHIQERRKGKYNSTGCHISDAVKPILDIGLDFHVYAHNDILISRINNSIDLEEKKYIDDFFADSDYIGFQFFTGTYDEVEEKWITDRGRNWDNENVSEFVKICNENGINLLTFSSHPYADIQTERLKNVSVLGFVYAISKLKLLVGIDGSGGHIAAFYNVPSITIWGKQTPEYFYNIGIKQEKLQHNKISYRPLRKNISIWSNERCIENVNFKVVFDKMVGVLNGDINISEDVLGYYDQSNCIKVE